MVRQDLKRLESLMMQTFDHQHKSNSSIGNVPQLLSLDNDQPPERSSLTELPSLRNSIEI
jgi:hypothetical protein